MMRFLAGVLSLMLLSLPVVARPLNPTEVGELAELLRDRRVLTRFSRTVTLEPWGEVLLVVSEDFNRPFGKLWIYLVQDGAIVYTLPQSQADTTWSLFELKAVHLTDSATPRLIILGDYITGIGERGAIPFTYALLYSQTDDTFTVDESRSWEISQEGISSIADVEAALAE
ncbi:MAG: hypothetical protein HC926_03585 [Synechococcaceae cyanobacterium SM2_3_60]|nr:hypothetical protein [Synechococcaceae cyanobacterium SM2_3_60]